ncbi:hypothetical protein [Mycolicibacterium sp. CR10]|uniref:hypothetical protein n=1 Tax=Mycolicibacterium sp. CR10 TaxID=2562314 RepID=UPI0010C069AB|nr:hypothetical protein [Mycolicibacterium sp. CR10]
MTVEARQIAASLAAVSEVFPIKQTDSWASRADAIADGNVLTIVVTDHLGRAQREYRAVIQLVFRITTQTGVRR